MDPGKNLGKCGEHRKKRWEDLRKSEELGENPRKTDGTWKKCRVGDGIFGDIERPVGAQQ
jgi:hypothetical protein